MTEKLFWQDPYRTQFTARVQDHFPFGNDQAVILDRTCFYATSGGQPNDSGTIDQIPVKDVLIAEGKLLHILPSLPEGAEVKGEINWNRRFDHMQQHSGQHILSAAFFRLFKAETSSFHLGAEYCSIELNRPSLSEHQIREAEDAANNVVSSAFSVRDFSVDPDNIKDYPLRKQSDLTEALRIIQIGDFDMSPCSGTHVRNSSEVGVIFVHGFEKLSQTVKIIFVCGNRVRKMYIRDLAILKSISKSMTTSFELLPESITKMQTQIKELRRELAHQNEERLKREALLLYENEPPVNGRRVLIAVMNRPYSEVRTLAQSLVEQTDASGAFASSEDSRIVFFKSRNMEYDLKKVFHKFQGITSAKGGGPPHFQEAGGIPCNQATQDLLRKIFQEEE